jgi:hypothetical protein
MRTALASRGNIEPMTHTFGQLPRPEPRETPSRITAGDLIALMLLFGFSTVPRLWILGFWIFGGQLGDAFSSWIIPAAGFIVAPWTTLLYAWMWAISSEAVTGWEWMAVGFGFLLDVWFLAVVARLLR